MSSIKLLLRIGQFRASAKQVKLRICSFAHQDGHVMRVCFKEVDAFYGNFAKGVCHLHGVIGASNLKDDFIFNSSLLLGHGITGILCRFMCCI